MTFKNEITKCLIYFEYHENICRNPRIRILESKELLDSILLSELNFNSDENSCFRECGEPKLKSFGGKAKEFSPRARFR